MTSQFAWGLVVSALAALTAVGCGGAVHPGEPTPTPVTPGSECSTSGATAPAADGCNTCVCSAGAWSCTEKACPTTCTPGATKPADDGCNTCSCTANHEWACTLRACQGSICGGIAGFTCRPTEYCAFEPGQLCGAADASSVCKPRPELCDQLYAPVCGCNQKTYGNGCMAAMDGTGVYSQGPCNPPPPVCNEGDMTFDGCNSCFCKGGAWQCTTRACPPPVCKPGETKPAGDGCNTCTCSASGQWDCPIDAMCGKLCGGFAGFTCDASEYCAYSPGQLCGAADASAFCFPRPQACDQQFAPVCGCNQKTYDNACLAAMDGTGVYSLGQCGMPPACNEGEMRFDGCNSCLCTGGLWQCTTRTCPVRACGARAGNTCSVAEYCDYQPGEYCGGGDAESTCQPRPQACTTEYAPVCGCDQRTYSNACAAHVAGFGVYSTGPCVGLQ